MAKKSAGEFRNGMTLEIDGKVCQVVEFMHVKPGAGNNGGAAAGEVDGLATAQGMYSLVAYQRFLDGKTSLYDMSDLKVAAGAKGDG